MKTASTVSDRHLISLTDWLAGLIVVVLAVWGLRTHRDFQVAEQTSDARVKAYGNPVICRAGGLVAAVRFKENEVVEKGDTLLLIDPREYLLQLTQTEAAIRREEDQLELLTRAVHTLSQAAHAASAQMAASKARLEQQQVGVTRSALTKHANDYQAAQDRYGTAVAKMADSEMEKEVVKAHIVTLRALLARHKLDLSYTTIVAPDDGRMGRCPVAVGQNIEAGQVLAYMVNQDTNKWLVANDKQTQLAGLRLGDTTVLVTDAFRNHPFKGPNVSISPATGARVSPPDNSRSSSGNIVQRVPMSIRIAGPQTESNLLKADVSVNGTIAKQHVPKVLPGAMAKQ